MAAEGDLRVGVMGTANIARKNIAAMGEASGVTVVAVASRSLERARLYAVENGLPAEAAVGSYEELLSDAGVDAVYIPLPTTMHLEWVLKAAEAKKHVLCEKPCACDSEQLHTMVEACCKAGVLLMDGVVRWSGLGSGLGSPWGRVCMAEAPRIVSPRVLLCLPPPSPGECLTRASLTAATDRASPRRRSRRSPHSDAACSLPPLSFARGIFYRLPGTWYGGTYPFR